MCRTYDEKSCEVNADDVGITFHSPLEYLAYLKQHHKRVHTLIAKRFVPSDEALGSERGRTQRLPAFGPRYEAMRALGARR
jgi:hypothetical protein